MEDLQKKIRLGKEAPWYAAHAIEEYLAASSAGNTAHGMQVGAVFRWEPSPNVKLEVRRRNDSTKRASGLKGNKKPKAQQHEETMKQFKCLG